MCDHHVATAPLGGVERAVRGLDQIGGRLFLIRNQRFDADANGHQAAGRFGMGDEQVFDGLARLFGEGGGALEVEARQQQGEFLAAVTGNQDSLLQGDQRQCLADRAQAGVAPDMAVTIVSLK
jgi:hypothetical protein